MKWLAPLLCLLTWPLPGLGEGLGEFAAEYKLSYIGTPLRGKGTRELRREADGSYLFTSSARALLSSVAETSRFRLVGRRLVPLRYDYQRKGLGGRRQRYNAFEWLAEDGLAGNRLADAGVAADGLAAGGEAGNGLAGDPLAGDGQAVGRVVFAGSGEAAQTGGRVAFEGGSQAVAAGTLDRLLYQLQLRRDLQAALATGSGRTDFQYRIADDDDLKTLDFRLLGGETVTVPAGEIHACKLERVRQRRARQTRFWLAPEYGMLLVKLEQLEKNGKGFRLELRSINHSPSAKAEGSLHAANACR